MIIHLKLGGEDIFLNDWKRSSIYTEDWVRDHIVSDNNTDSCIYLLVTNSNDWAPVFLGPKLSLLTNIYQQFNPQPPVFTKDQLEDAQNHIDAFIRRFNALKVFL